MLSIEWPNSYEWCQADYENDDDCIRIEKKYSKDDSVALLCLSHVPCNEKTTVYLSELVLYSCIEFFYCDNLLIIQCLAGLAEVDSEIHNFSSLARGWASLIGPALNLVGSIFGGSNRMYSFTLEYIR